MKNLIFVCLLGLVCACGPGGREAVDELINQSFATADLEEPNPGVFQADGSRSFGDVNVSPITGATFSEDQKAWELTSTTGDGITFTIDVKHPGMIQLALDIAASSGTASYNVFVGETGKELKAVQATPIEDSNTKFHTTVIQIQGDHFKYNSNSIKVALTDGSAGKLYVKSAKFIPQKIFSEDGKLSTTLYAQFGLNDNVTGTGVDGGIWTRGFGLNETVEMIPGPTLFFKPEDLVSVNYINKLNPERSEVFQEFENEMAYTANTDEILANDALKGELNIPHNLNNTNLHVHGLHVDPSKDDVTIVIVPEGVDTAGYDAPHTHAPVTTLDSLNPYSVSDQGVKPGSWDYLYKIPKIHLPGTHWYHPHKHGATSAQVENGMAGTIVIQEDKSNAIVPYPGEPGAKTDTKDSTQTRYSRKDWEDYHDRVLAIQEISNFGAQKGEGNQLGDIKHNTYDVTINGIADMQINIRPKQLERWRIVNAGTNHRAFAHIWLGKYLGTDDTNKDANGVAAPIYEQVPIYLVAVDGITLPKRVPVTAEKPALMAPGNRSDFLVQLDKEATYVLFKNYKIPGGITIKNGAGKTLYRSHKATPKFWPAEANSKNNPYLFKNTGTDSSNFGGYTKYWYNKVYPVTPIIDTKPKTLSDGSNSLDVNFPTTKDFESTPIKGKWIPAKLAGGKISDAKLMTINVSGTALTTNETPAMPTHGHLKKLAPTTMTSPPSYVSPVTNKDVLQTRPVIFDISGVAARVKDIDSGDTVRINQFTLNGRFFTMSDPIGNPEGDSLIAVSYAKPKDIEYTPDQTTIPEKQEIEFKNSGSVAWHTNKVGPEYFFTNPAYYQSINRTSKKIKNKTTTVYSYAGDGTPSWQGLTGIPDKKEEIVQGASTETISIPQPAIVNTKATKYAANQYITPSLPVAQTGEEWILINNSDVSHPFHIHINPFFVEEVGQLSYENYKDGNGVTKTDWFIRAVTAKSAAVQRDSMPATGAVPGTVYKGSMRARSIVGNWWDTIIVPARGYVKVRYWFNVPNQTEAGKVVKVMDNYNKTGIWVYHCHILRHEDRGMMMPVITQPGKTEDE